VAIQVVALLAARWEAQKAEAATAVAAVAGAARGAAWAAAVRVEMC
jgi:hypothetical protein